MYVLAALEVHYVECCIVPDLLIGHYRMVLTGHDYVCVLIMYSMFRFLLSGMYGWSGVEWLGPLDELDQ